jgi:hypothetical protein
VSIYELKPGAKDFEEKEKQKAVASGVWVSDPSGDQRSRLLFEKQYWVNGSGLEWNSDWTSQNDLSIIFFDYGAGVSDAKKEAAKRILKTLKYHFSSDGIWREDLGQ